MLSHPIEKEGEDEASSHVDGVVHTGDQQHVHHKDEANEGHQREPLEATGVELQYDHSQRPRVA